MEGAQWFFSLAQVRFIVFEMFYCSLEEKRTDFLMVVGIEAKLSDVDILVVVEIHR